MVYVHRPPRVVFEDLTLHSPSRLARSSACRDVPKGRHRRLNPRTLLNSRPPRASLGATHNSHMTENALQHRTEVLNVRLSRQDRLFR